MLPRPYCRNPRRGVCKSYDAIADALACCDDDVDCTDQELEHMAHEKQDYQAAKERKELERKRLMCHRAHTIERALAYHHMSFWWYHRFNWSKDDPEYDGAYDTDCGSFREEDLDSETAMEFYAVF